MHSEAIAHSKAGLFSKVSLLLTPGLAITALGAYLGSGITSGWTILGLAIAFLLGGFAARAIAAINKPLGFLALGVWTFITGLFLGPCLAFYVAELGGATVALAFIGSAGVMAVCGLFAVFSGRDFSNWGTWLTFALLGLIVAGIVNIFISFGTLGTLLYSGIGMVVFAGFFIFDFFRMSRSENTWDAAIDVAFAQYLNYINFVLYLLRFLLALLGGNSSKD